MACVSCVLGIPGTGKTQFCLQLSSLLKREFCDSSVLIVSYDSLIPAKEEELLINSSINDPKLSEWKNRRRRIVNAVGGLLGDFFEKQEFANEEMEEIRTSILAQNKIDKSLRLNKNLFVIIDDNLYYRSMRYEYFQVARTYECGFCQIYLNCDISIALQRNTSRMHSVSEEVIKAMANKLEEPLPDKSQWEKYSISICTSFEVTDSELSKTTELIRTSIENPFQQLNEIDEEIKQNSRQISNTNIIHQVDNFLRKAAGQLIKQLNCYTVLQSFIITHFLFPFKGKSASQINEVNTARQTVLKAVKSGYLILPSELTTLVETGLIVNASKSDKLKEFLLEKLKEQLSKC
uniref:L-seryl-tRNA(Sec) kinase n=1 Tax=Strigamia maritima TaxID=126957 RepID=T1IIU3_STRMM